MENEKTITRREFLKFAGGVFLGSFIPKEMLMEKGMERIRAKKDVKSVPARNGRAPNVSVAGFQVFP